jgi:hypothetical protein
MGPFEGEVGVLTIHFSPTIARPIAFAMVDVEGTLMGTTNTLDRYVGFASTNGILGESTNMTWLSVHFTSSILIPPIAERESVDGMVNECEARRTEY